MNLLPLILSFEPELLMAYPCSMRESHLNDPNIVLECPFWRHKRVRREPWIQLASDRFRFPRRIRDFDSKFGYIFGNLHREYIYDLIQVFILQAMIVDLFRTADRHRFQRRINEFDSKFGYIFGDLHREYVCDLIRANALIDDLIELNVND
jgi:hypothetical protein